MTDSLAQTDYITTSNDSVDTIEQEITTITLTSSGSDYYYSTGDTITISNGGTGMGYTIGSNMISNPSMTISSNGNVGIGTISGSSIFQWKNEEFVDCLPDFTRVQAMCEQYPGLRIAYEKFVTTYKLVKDDYDSPKD
jgi:hypothetical protein